MGLIQYYKKQSTALDLDTLRRAYPFLGKSIMAAKNKSEVVPSLPPQTEPDLEDLLAKRLADDLIAEIDMGKLTKFAIAHLGKGLKSRFIDWLKADNSQRIALTVILDYARKQDKFVTASQVKAGARLFRDSSVLEIRRYFQWLADEGFGVVRGDVESLEFSVS